MNNRIARLAAVFAATVTMALGGTALAQASHGADDNGHRHGHHHHHGHDDHGHHGPNHP